MPLHHTSPLPQIPLVQTKYKRGNREVEPATEAAFRHTLDMLMDPSIEVNKRRRAKAFKRQHSSHSKSKSIGSTTGSVLEKAVEALPRITTQEMIVRLYRAAIEKDLKDDDLERAVRVITLGSKYPVLTSLKLADMFTQLE